MEATKSVDLVSRAFLNPATSERLTRTLLSMIHPTRNIPPSDPMPLELVESLLVPFILADGLAKRRASLDTDPDFTIDEKYCQHLAFVGQETLGPVISPQVSHLLDLEMMMNMDAELLELCTRRRGQKRFMGELIKRSNYPVHAAARLLCSYIAEHERG